MPSKKNSLDKDIEKVIVDREIDINDVYSKNNMELLWLGHTLKRVEIYGWGTDFDDKEIWLYLY